MGLSFWVLGDYFSHTQLTRHLSVFCLAHVKYSQEFQVQHQLYRYATRFLTRLIYELSSLIPKQLNATRQFS
jgi:hypothetical protein